MWTSDVLGSKIMAAAASCPSLAGALAGRLLSKCNRHLPPPPLPASYPHTQLSWDSLPESQLWLGPRLGRSPLSLKLAGIPPNSDASQAYKETWQLSEYPQITLTIVPLNGLGRGLWVEIFPSRLWRYCCYFKILFWLLFPVADLTFLSRRFQDLLFIKI